MIEFFLACSVYAWTPSTGSVAFYELYIDGRRYHENAFIPEHEVCVYDDLPHILEVVAVGPLGQRSEPSEPSDLHIYPPTEYRIPASDVLRLDLNGNGVVDAADFGRFANLFGARHCFGESCP